jgi:WD40 repeat protein
VRQSQQNEQWTTATPDWLPSMRHDGCINTACWLDCPWRLASSVTGGRSLSSGDPLYLPTAVASGNEIPTQIATSGDDRMIKFWDVQNAMGSASPLQGGWDTFSPLSSTPAQTLGSAEQYQTWKNYYQERKDVCKVAGSVRLLASINSKHRGNVFHVSPIGNMPGKMLSSGADGYLRISDLESSSSDVVINPHIHDDIDDELPNLVGGMFGVIAFSHQLLTSNTGLLCCQRGLFRFDIRLPPNSQPRRSLLEPIAPGASRSTPCKACAIWSPNYNRSYGSLPQYIHNESEPSYIFVGGIHANVELLDLRMLGGASPKSVLQRYCPTELEKYSSASVSGIDVSKDGRELLVSYENDQIYTFPVFHEASCYSAGPSSREMDDSSKTFTANETKYISELTSYGGHLNRHTFLKNATYAGPNDEYILTGSDSGKAWIYERSTGSVAALLSADLSTCNGVVAHPTLPFFVTYGIDPTAKLWRAAATQDSPMARASASVHMSRCELSAVTRKWDKVQTSLHRFENTSIPFILPDLIVAPEDMTGSSRFDPLTLDISTGCLAELSSPEYGNALRCLLSVLRQTKYTCYRACREDRNPPVEQSLNAVAVGISWNRLRLQAARLGMRVNAWAPWIFESNLDVQQQRESLLGFHRADLVPDYPSDWIFYDPQMILKCIMDVHCLFKRQKYLDVLQRQFPQNHVFFGGTLSEKIVELRLPWLTDEQQQRDLYIKYRNDKKSGITKSQVEGRSRVILEETISVLKEGGNEAMKLGLFHKAVYRYDKAMQYCAVAFMEYPVCQSILSPLSQQRSLPTPFTAKRMPGYNSVIVKQGTSTIITWSPTLRVLIASRLNIALLLLKPEFLQPSVAADQARAALKILLPFATAPGYVVVIGTVNKKSKGRDDPDHPEQEIMRAASSNEPSETFYEAKALQSKAYFRLGCAQYDLHEYSEAEKSFVQSLDSSRLAKCDSQGNDATNSKPDPLLLRRIKEARLMQKKKNTANRKK